MMITDGGGGGTVAQPVKPKPPPPPPAPKTTSTAHTTSTASPAHPLGTDSIAPHTIPPQIMRWAEMNGVMGSTNAAAAPKPAPPAGVFSSKPDPKATALFNQATGGYDNNALTSQFIGGTSLKGMAQYALSSSQQKQYSEMTPEQRTQVAMQAMGPQGTAYYLSSLQHNIDSPQSGGLNQVYNGQQAMSQFQTNFGNLVDQGKISDSDIQALATAPSQIFSSGGTASSNNPFGPTEADLSGTAHMIAGMNPNYDPKITAAQNQFVNDSYSAGDKALGSNGKNAQATGNFLYAQGTQALSGTPWANQEQYLYDTPSKQVGNIVNHSLQGEVEANNSAQNTPGPNAAPFNGTGTLMNVLSSDGWSDSGRLPSGSKQQQDILSAYNAATGLLGSKGDTNFSSLTADDKAGSGLRTGLADLFQAGFPTILNNTWKNGDSSGAGGNAAVGQAFGQFNEFELGGSYSSKGQGQGIGATLGQTYGEFYGDLANASQSKAGTQALYAKYGTQMFATSPGSDEPQREDALGKGFDLFGAIMHGTNQGFGDLETRAAQNSQHVDPSALSGFAGALATTIGSGLLVVAPEASPLFYAAGGLVTAGSAASLAPAFSALGSSSNAPKLPSNLNWQSQPVGQTQGFTDSSLQKLLMQIDSATSQLSSADKAAFDGGLYEGG